MTIQGFVIFAQTSTQSFRTTELDLPESTAGILLLLCGLVALFGLATWTSLRDSRFLALPWRTTLLILRTVVLVLTMIVLLNPRERMQTTQVQKSRVGVLVDTSLSMAYPAADSNQANTTQLAPDASTRAHAVQEMLVASGLLDKLSATHAVSVYTFDSALSGPQAIITDEQTTFVKHLGQTTGSESQGSSYSQDSPDDATRRVDLADATQRSPAETARKWEAIFQPRGGETRLGEALHQLVGQLSGRTLAGLVVLTDGRSNAGLDAEVARLRAERSDTRLITVGVGSQRAQMNLWVAGMQSPSDVHRGDPFDISVVLQGSGMQEQSGVVRLFQQSAGSDGKDRRQVAEEPFQLTDPSIPAGVQFQQQLSVPGKYEFIAVAELSDDTLVELTVDDNQRRREVEITDRKQKVLVISSGPMREYRFVRNALYRHSGIESDVWLQTVTNENLGFVSQEAEKLLTSFPKT
ncbi:MAG: vWA domain-containing protein, partial [Fuerstiella sp.]